VAEVEGVGAEAGCRVRGHGEPGDTSAISLHLPSIDVRRSSGKCLRQGAGPGRDRADCSGGAPRPPRASGETVMPWSRGGGAGLRHPWKLRILACPRPAPKRGQGLDCGQSLYRSRETNPCGSQRSSPSCVHNTPGYPHPQVYKGPLTIPGLGSGLLHK
jgi:hypothetical protein